MVPAVGAIDYAKSPVPPTLQANWPPDLKDGLQQALVQAGDLDEKLYNAMWKNDAYSFATGLGMFAAGIATLAFGVFDASRTLLLAGGVTTASLAGMRTFYPFQARNELYAKGRTALQCAVQVTRAGIALNAAGPTTGGETLREVLNNAQQAAFELQAQAGQVAAKPASGDVRTEVARALFVPSAEQNASDLLAAVNAGRAVESQLEPELLVAFLQNALTKIHAIVDAEADKLQPNPEEALKQARTQLTDNLTAIKTSALEARDLARQVDHNRVKASAAGAGAGGGTGSASGAGAGGAAGGKPSGAAGGAQTPADQVVQEAGKLQAKMQTVDAKLSNIDACIAAIDGSST